MKPITIKLQHFEKPYKLSFTISAFEKISDIMPDDEKDYKDIPKLLSAPATTCEVCAILMEAAAANGEKTPSVEDVKKSKVFEMKTIRETCLRAILEGLGIEDNNEDEEIDAVLAQKNAEKGA